ncbi:protein XRI1-like isoform X1 [Carex littledalei]|uniref:Protein XRI1-like isoform X1 n=1 Tax=Carex littledalei TaxID=544730 RepID=A0A833V4M0_9POAL|nr:protein XRI1-like isoform X1 [Carex littledalei]
MELYNGTNDESKDSIDFFDWKDEDYCLTSNPASDFANLLWDDLNRDENDILHLLGDQTPMKECMNFENIPFDYGDYTNKGLQEEIAEPPSMVKRRKMLQFTADSNGEDAEKNPITSSTLTSVSSTSSNGISESLRISTNSISNYSETANALPVVGLSHSSEWWNGNSTPEKLSYYSSDETSCSKNYVTSPFDKINISGLGEVAADGESEVVEQTTKLSTLRIFKGKKTVIKAPKKLTSSVAYPFTMIKPFGVQEGVTLDDINAKIHAPPVIKKKLQHVGNFAYPISQFSGKPVVGKKKICTEGGKGSITILRTKG